MPFIDERDLKSLNILVLTRWANSRLHEFVLLVADRATEEENVRLRLVTHVVNPTLKKKIKYKIRLPVCEKLFFLIHR